MFDSDSPDNFPSNSLCEATYSFDTYEYARSRHPSLLDS